MTNDFWALLNTGMNSSFRNGYKPSRVSFVISNEKFIHTVNQQRRLLTNHLLQVIREEQARHKLLLLLSRTGGGAIALGPLVRSLVLPRLKVPG